MSESTVPNELRGKLALITGGSGGIGRATAFTLARRGCSIALHYHANTENAKSVVSEIGAKYPGVQVVAFPADLSSYDEVRRLYGEVVEKLGAPDVLYNNAGVTGPILGRKGNMEDLSMDDFERTWRINAGSAFLLTQLCVPHMRTQKWGRIVFCSSVAANTGGVVGPHYASSKSALHGFIHYVAQRYAKDGITCNGVAPALIVDTGMIPSSREDYEALIPVGRLGRPDEIASVVELLVDNAYMTNKIIVADGGWTGGF